MTPLRLKNQRQSKRHQRIKCADDQAVEDVEKDDLAHAAIFAVREMDG